MLAVLRLFKRVELYCRAQPHPAEYVFKGAGMTSPQIVVLVLGGIMILAGLLGGRLELKELRIPRIGGGARVSSLAVGAALLALGLSMETVPSTDRGTTAEAKDRD